MPRAERSLGWLARTHLTANPLPLGRGEGKRSIYCKCQNKEHEPGKLKLKKPELPDGFQGRGFKGEVRERLTGCVTSSCTIL